MKITLISDTHNKHKQIENDLIGGDILIHAGDISSGGSLEEINNFCRWFDKLDNYTRKIFIAGNHDFGFESKYDETMKIVSSYDNITYLQDSHVMVDGIKIYGSPWQPRFYDWAFNVDRGEKIKEYWDKIPIDTNILITHGPAYGILDTVIGEYKNLGCEELYRKIIDINPNIHISGHIHSGYGYKEFNNTHFFNASALDERYNYGNKPINIDFDKEKNSMDLL